MKRRMILAGTAIAGLMYACALADPASDAASLDEVVADWADARDFNGVMMAGRNGTPIWQWVSGTADPETGRALTAETRFQTGSVDKYFAALAVFALVEQGRVDLDAPIRTYLPGFRADTGDRLTLRALLSNQSGLPNDILQAFRSERAAVDALTPGQAVERYASGDLKHDPGRTFDYVLTNWLVVQHLLATVTGQSYGEVLQTLVFEPAGMVHSGVYTHDLTETRPHSDDVAIGHDPADPEGRGDYWSPRFLTGSFTTAADLLRLEHALDDGQVLNADSLETFRTVQVPSARYGFGGRYDVWEICGRPQRVSTQSGSNGATNITSAHMIGHGGSVVMLTNVDESQGEMFARSAMLLAAMQGCGTQ
ncbi:serine hydrolase domain-containing protein [Maricaulis sp.]|uniref:serine hydrolase domain-containing protein n=1 Tax=Maricaulis sp. TaxID=1486257 RepID=UPI00262F365E|nr:serine hydrolase domain-containing protein [Maricaulis sp.]